MGDLPENRVPSLSNEDDASEQIEAQLRLVTDHAPVLLVHCDRNARFKFVNKPYADRLGLTPKEIVGRRIPDVIGEAAYESFRTYVEATLMGQRVEFEVEIPYEKIGPRVMHCACVPDVGPDGQVRGLVGVLSDVTQRKRAEEALRDSEQRFARFMQHLPGLAWIKDTNGRYVYVNDAAEKAFRTSRAELYGKTDYEVFPRETAEQFAHNDRMAIASGAGIQVVEALAQEDGSVRYSLVSKFPLTGLDGQVSLVGGMAIDITDRRRAEEEVRHNEERFRSLMEQAPFSIQVFSPDGRTIRVNQAWEDLWGVRFQQIQGYNILEDRQLAARGVLTYVHQGFAGQSTQIPAIEYDPNQTIPDITQHADPRRWLSAVIYPIKDADGRVQEVVLIHQDVTHRKRLDDELRLRLEQLAESEQRFRQLADAMPQIVWTARPDGEIEYMNRRWSEFTGLPETMGNAGWAQILHPHEAKPAGERWAASVQTGDTFEMELRLLDRRSNTYRWHLLRTVAVRDEQGAIVRWFGTSTDIHEQKRAEETSRYLAEASAALASVVDFESTLQKVANLAVPYFADWSAIDVVGVDGGLRRLAVAHIDADKVAMTQQLMQEYPPDPNSSAGPFAVLRTGKAEISREITEELLKRVAKDDRHLSILQSLGLRSYICVPLVASGTPLGVLTFATAESGRHYTDADLVLASDLAHRAAVALENTRLYQALRETDRRKDEFLATLAHELRNPLAPIRNSLQILKMPRVDPETTRQTREMMERQVHHLVRLVDDLLDVSRVMRGKIELRKEAVELASIVARGVETAKPLIELQNHQLNVSLPDESLQLDADPVRLAQVIGNLLTNAAKYTEPNGHITVTARPEGDEAILSICDDGIGIAPEMLAHVFELFVQADHSSTKAQGGLGIGLTLVKNLVEMHGGTVEAHSAGIGKGTEFIVRLPLMISDRDQSTGNIQQLSNIARRRSGHRLLVVDDNMDAAVSLATLLKLQGHEVHVVNDGRAAIEAAKKHRPALIFLDIGMPGMDGYEVARVLRQTPGLENAVLTALTGWGQQEDRRRSAEAGFDHHLVKPPEPKVLEDLISSLGRKT